jgi:hypothetical protein
MPDRSSDSDHQVIVFPRRSARNTAGGQRLQESSPVGDLRKFEQTQDGDDYRHRMMVNIAAGAVALLLIIAGLWLADALSSMRKNQDCVLSGRRGCTPVDAPVQPRGEISSPQQR